MHPTGAGWRAKDAENGSVQCSALWPVCTRWSGNARGAAQGVVDGIVSATPRNGGDRGGDVVVVVVVLERREAREKLGTGEGRGLVGRRAKCKSEMGEIKWLRLRSARLAAIFWQAKTRACKPDKNNKGNSQLTRTRTMTTTPPTNHPGGVGRERERERKPARRRVGPAHQVRHNAKPNRTSTTLR
ncbi:hypothetical protein BD289DRAFT_50481 [Coniella lustricola]|uniref:Uncharacterized protein n=1 Tax=Coniella lustricola TaxID=2025994 RepID=A0A2T3A1A6_9PEZI|nr:hypothetical protein BD289DRAFT_50481 [Coniella lustricola]